MKRMTLDKALLFFYALDIFLLFVFLISFVPLFRKNRLKSEPTVLLNPNYVSDIASIAIESPESKITLEKGDDYWIGFSSESKDKYIWPADIQAIGNLIDNSQKIIKVQKKAEGISSWNALGVDEGQATSITFYDSVGSVLSQIYFGLKDKLTMKLYFRTWTKQIVYEGDSFIEPYLNTDESFWADSYIFPQCMTNYKAIESESLLRRGKVQNLAPREGLSVDYNLGKDFENGSKIYLSIYKKDDEYIVIPKLISGPATAEKDKDIIKKINYRYSISSWTLENLLK